MKIPLVPLIENLKNNCHFAVLDFILNVLRRTQSTPHTFKNRLPCKITILFKFLENVGGGLVFA